ncbi:flagellar biosynthetic protein FliR [Alicyclobacillus tolerans]|uniref:Flagellar biosynthetic protein FliR n=1 Tax=Alicyclobacillus tolerans TaxID=90970 RepID=A0ABT9LX61_9BACL|nr:flagellar biosynthetic protein FliR [Alicyclobacillus tengchongensis]MDP9728860.1 flagellar biosynthetic protein FliR [Alicyclobacillus tengchongensis]
MLNLAVLQYPLFFLIMARMAGFIGASPLFSMTAVPRTVKIGLVVFLALWVLPTVQAKVPSPFQQTGLYVGLLVLELVTGLFMGFIATSIFSILNLAGQIIDVQIGFASAELFNPESSFVTGLSGTFFNMIFTLFFLGADGLDGLALTGMDSYKLIPLGQFHLPQTFGLAFEQLMDLITADAVQVAAPVLVALLLTNVTFALLSKAVPQMNVYFSGLPIQLFIGLSVFAASVPAFVSIFHVLFTFLFSQVTAFMQLTG